MSSSLTVQNLSVRIGEKKILEGLDFSVAKGEIVFLLGRSGTGKSVLLKTLVGLIERESGCVDFDLEVGPFSIENLKEEAWEWLRRRVGYVPQLPIFFDSLTLLENFFFFKKEATKNEIEGLFDRYQIPKAWLRATPSTLSFGALKVLSFIQRIFLEPEILLLDEPTTSLDYHWGRRLNALIRRIVVEKKLTALVVSHDLKYALEIADRLLFLDNGKIQFETTPQGIYQVKNPLVERFLECR